MMIRTVGNYNQYADNHGVLRDEAGKPDLIQTKNPRAKPVRARVDAICIWCGEPSKTRMCKTCGAERTRRVKQLEAGRNACNQGGSKSR